MCDCILLLKNTELSLKFSFSIANKNIGITNIRSKIKLYLIFLWIPFPSYEAYSSFITFEIVKENKLFLILSKSSNFYLLQIAKGQFITTKYYQTLLVYYYYFFRMPNHLYYSVSSPSSSWLLLKYRWQYNNWIYTQHCINTRFWAHSNPNLSSPLSI